MERSGLPIEDDAPAIPDEVLESYKRRERISNSNTSKMSYYSVACIVVNRMIGSGIFRTPTTVINGTSSVGAALLFWFAGACAALAGTIVFVELGLTMPVYNIGGLKRAVPRNGGDLNYLQYLYHRPQRLAVCIFTVLFITLGNTASNALFVGEYSLMAFGTNPPDDKSSVETLAVYNAKVRGIALGAVTFACAMHGLWRKGGIYLNNVFATVKLLILLIIIIIGICAWTNTFGSKANHASTNMEAKNSFADATSSTYGYCQAYLAVIFAYGGFDQANYVLGEVKHPKKTFTKSAIWSVIMVCILYMLVNIAFMVVVPKADQLKLNADVALQFFQLTIANEKATRTVAALMTISGLGNIIVMTFAASRVKQEIGKEGLLPPRAFSVFIGKNRRVRKLFRALFGKTQSQALDAATPVGGLLLHWSSCLLLIFATWSTKPEEAYRILVNLYSYTIEAFFGVALGAGMIYLRLRRSPEDESWDRASPFKWYVSITAAVLYTVANAFPIVAMWIPPASNEKIHDQTQNLYPGYKSFFTPTIGWSLIAGGVVYWLALTYLLPRIGDNHGKKLMVLKDVFVTEYQGSYVQNHEIVGFEWEAPSDEMKYVQSENETRMPDGGVVTVHVAHAR